MAEKLELFLSAQEPLTLEAFQTTITGSGGSGQDGKDGITFVPHIDDEGILSWTNDGGLQNPSPLKIKGEDGANGKDGVSPVRGTDYWTDADIATIKSYVDNAILGGAW